MIPNDNEVNGKLNEGIGRVKEGVGRATGDVDLEMEGQSQHDSGVVEGTLGKARRKIGEAVSDIGHKLGR